MSGRRKHCPICTRPRDAAADAAAAELPPLLSGNLLIVAAFESLSVPPCQRCVDRALSAFTQRGFVGALQYLATAAALSRTVRKAKRLR